MKLKVVIVILVIAAIALAIALLAIKKQGAEQHATDLTAMGALSNDVLTAQSKVNDLNDVNLSLSNNLVAASEQVANLSNNLAATSATLAASQSDLAAGQASAKSQIAGLNSQIAGLQNQNKTLDDQLGAMTNAMSQLNAQIAATQQQLAHANSDNAFLQQALQTQMAQKAELEHKFNNLTALRQQEKKIKHVDFVTRRIQIANNPPLGMKGAALLVWRRDHPYTEPAAPTPAESSLNVEIGSDGSVHVIPPLGATTNSAAH